MLIQLLRMGTSAMFLMHFLKMLWGTTRLVDEECSGQTRNVVYLVVVRKQGSGEEIVDIGMLWRVDAVFVEVYPMRFSERILAFVIMMMTLAYVRCLDNHRFHLDQLRKRLVMLFVFLPVQYLL